MKAIQIRYLGATNTKGARLKAWTDAGALIQSREYSEDVGQQARELAKNYISKMGWDTGISGFGQLPNGDYVATLIA